MSNEQETYIDFAVLVSHYMQNIQHVHIQKALERFRKCILNSVLYKETGSSVRRTNKTTRNKAVKY